MLEDDATLAELSAASQEAVSYMASLPAQSDWWDKKFETLEGPGVITLDYTKTLTDENYMGPLSQVARVLELRNRLNDLTISIMDGVTLYLARVGENGGLSGHWEFFKRSHLAVGSVAVAQGPQKFGRVTPRMAADIYDSETAVVGMVQTPTANCRDWCKYILSGGKPFPKVPPERHSILMRAARVQQSLLWALNSAGRLRASGHPDGWSDHVLGPLLEVEWRTGRRAALWVGVNQEYDGRDLVAEERASNLAIRAGVPRVVEP